MGDICKCRIKIIKGIKELGLENKEKNIEEILLGKLPPGTGISSNFFKFQERL